MTTPQPSPFDPIQQGHVGVPQAGYQPTTYQQPEYSPATYPQPGYPQGTNPQPGQTPGYPQSASWPGYAPAPATPPAKSTAALVNGILGLVFSLLPVTFVFGWVLCILGIVLGSKKRSTAGMVCGIIGLVCTLVAFSRAGMALNT